MGYLKGLAAFYFILWPDISQQRPSFLLRVYCGGVMLRSLLSWLSMYDRTPGLKLVGEPFAPALHLQLERSLGSRDLDMQHLRKIVDHVSLCFHLIKHMNNTAFQSSNSMKIFLILCGVYYFTSCSTLGLSYNCEIFFFYISVWKDV